MTTSSCRRSARFLCRRAASSSRAAPIRTFFQATSNLEYSRFALADISGLNFNVAYELGARHRAREYGTAIFRQTQFSPPFDLRSIKAFPYEFEPANKAAEARELMTRVLTESLIQNRLASPVRLALGAQHASGKIDGLLAQAENEIRKPNWTGSIEIYRQAILIDPDNPLARMKLGILCRDREIWDEALEQFTRATAVPPGYGEAWREKGIVENNIAHNAKKGMDTDPAPGEPSLRRAIELNDKDFDALASLGGVLKRAKRFTQALCGDPKAFLDVAIRGFEQTDANGQGKTFVDSLRLLLPASDKLPGLKEGLAELEQMVQ